MTAIETLENFFAELKKKDCKYVDVKKYITKTQQIESEFVGKKNVESHLNGIYNVVQYCSDVKIKEKISTNNVMKTFILTFIGQSKVKMECTCVKEIDKRKPDKNGVWGVNVESFKLIK